MQAALKLNTTVLPGHRIEVAAPELPEGANVELIVMLNEPTLTIPPQESLSMLELLGSLPKSPTPRAFSTWEEYERFLQEEKDSWDR